MTIINRDTKEVKEIETSKIQRFLYRTFLGRIVLKLLSMRIVSKLVGRYFSSKLSCRRIKKFIKKNKIDMTKYEITQYQSYNDFFTRRLLNIQFSKVDIDFCSPCDCKLSVYPIEEHSIFQIKDAYYKISDLLQNEVLAKKYEHGLCIICRLEVDDYHRYHYLDDGVKGENIFIKGCLHTVHPIALEKYNFYKTNCREYSILKTAQFGDIVQIEVGAMMVGRIENYHHSTTIKRGQEKGRFLFGGSTIVLLVEPNMVQMDEDLLQNTSYGMETIIHCGEKIGCKAC